MSAHRKLSLWLGSFLIVASFLYFHFQVPLVPIVLAGGLTLAITLLRYWPHKKTSSLVGRNS